MTKTSPPRGDCYSLTLNVRKKYQRTLKVAATLAHDMGMIEDDSLTELINLFFNLGLEYVKNESLKWTAPLSEYRRDL